MNPNETGACGHILVVDDNEVNRMLLEMRLQLKGYTVTTLEGGAEALREMREKSFDLVLLDIMMPEVSGLDVLKHIRATKSRDEMPVIMTTAKDQSSDIVEALSLGANDYVTKPIDFPVLLARMDSHLQLSRLARQKDLFLTIASHDLKNPLAVIRGFASLLQMVLNDEVINRDEGKAMASQIHKQTQTMERIVTDYLDFQALQDGQLRLNCSLVDINTIARNVVEAQQPVAAEKVITLRVAPADNLPQVRADLQRLQQVCENLVSNAIKFSPQGSAVTVRTHLIGSKIRFEVEDAGPGISDKEQAGLFTMYAKLSNQPTGGEKSSGLGLAIGNYLVRMHRGEIGMYNNQGGPGATFWFELPVS